MGGRETVLISGQLRVFASQERERERERERDQKYLKKLIRRFEDLSKQKR